ncbi:acyl-CoA dehydrogenase family protein [Sphingoaurantiacus capsulatus]|uniref:Acyl-CoA dehydrogenase family protein n=1 Tax=Sphingoaurantiacus capsulatus TaxID=1771310 RepID=A0ABV7X9Z3_9SPHN
MSVPSLATAAFMADEELSIFSNSVGRFLDDVASPEAIEGWRQAKQVDRAVWRQAGEAGLLGVSVPVEYGGAGGDFRHEAAIIEEIGHRGADALTICLHNAVILPYLLSFGTEAQKQRWVPRLCTGELVAAIAMTEPGAGSDLQAMRTAARRDRDGYAISGQKTFISNGQIANLIIVAAKTDPNAGSRGLSLFVVETDGAGPSFQRGRNLDKVGQEGQDTSELFFDAHHVPADCLLGEIEGEGLAQLMQKLPQERLVIAWQSISMIERALAVTLEHVKQRQIFGQPLAAFQNTQFTLAEYKTEATIARVFVNECTARLLAGTLDSATGSMAKYWVSDLLSKIVDGCLQLFGGYGYMNEYPIARMYRDSRIHRIYGGANEVMKLLIARTL